ncbi:helix-turn-helix domain-containing protein [Clostridium botulinum]|uniref:Helix-turn-helix domain-containing protein n=2 Tax=Clostridium botulinum TaxID=1491 RepID=A0A9Q1ZBZ2_CLOBO|nr:helix-turn-helix domain-containing protein [Clostridium botulinum]KEH96431.1 hypothetical protein Z953_p0003 [Clostridium botulinum D str. 16868]AEB77205.1 conserved hypothetical protein [Clostridium botulinum BKT015925]KEH96410.1 hypothetical protein Y848_14155 [Clostridium botulinum C/D str. Sp77]KLU74312.1 hypothetical protein CBC3_p0003 [Clostridium botulinum V891]KOA75491.1 hypothetical protein ADU78_07465 [Clostridium botulinum]
MKKYTIDEIMDLKEVADKYNLNLNTLRSICNNASHGLIQGVDYRRAGRVWLITKDAVKKIIENTKNS